MQSLALPESSILSSKLAVFTEECCSEDAYVPDTDYFVKTLRRMEGKGVRPDLIGSIIIHYTSKWLPELRRDEAENEGEDEGESIRASWLKKRFFIETLVGILPREKDTVPCSFLLRVLRVANMVGVEAGCRGELEHRVSWQLDEASLRELMIPCFSDECSTLLDFELVIRLVKRFLSLEEVARSGGALMKVAKLVDSYLAEAAVDSQLTPPQFVALATALPSHARSTDDALYRAIDIYLKAHPGLSKQERKTLCMVIESRKLSAEASIHAAQNERLPVRAVIQVLLSEQDKLSKHMDWSPDATARCPSKREILSTQEMEMRRLKEEIVTLQRQCMNMERQMEMLLEKKTKKKGGYFSWKKLAIPAFKPNKMDQVEADAAFRLNTPMQMKARLIGGSTTSTNWTK